MSRGKIQGITIEINADTSSIKDALKDVDKASGKTTRELNQVQRALKFDPNNTVLLAQKQELLQEQIKNTTTRLDALKQAQSEVDRLFANGEIDATVYREFYRELEITSGKLERYKEQIQSMEDAQNALGNSTRQLNNLFTATGKSIDDFADTLGNDLVRAIKEGRASTQQLDQAFDRIGQTVLGTDADLDRLRASLRDLDNGRSLEQVRQDLQEIEDSARSTTNAVEGLSDVYSALGGIVAGVGIGKAMEKALEESDLDAKIDVTFDIPDSSEQAVRDALISVKKYGVEGDEALEGLRRQWTLNKDATDEANRKIVEGAGAITKAYGDIDFKELIQETNEIASELKTTNEEALNIVNSLLQIGFPPEQLDIISEYGNQLQRAGFSAKEVAGIMASASQQKSWNIDNLLDSLKEGRIRASEMGAGISTGLQENLKKATGVVEGASAEQLEVMREGFDKQERALEKSLSNRENALSKSHDQQQKTLEKSLDAEMTAFEKVSDRKMKLLDAEYMAKLKVIDEEKYNQLKAIDDQIKALEDLTDAENKAQQAKADAEKRAELQKNVESARTKHDRKKAEEELIKYNEQLALKALQSERKDKIDALKDEKDDVKDIFDEKKDALKTEFDQKKDQLREINNAERDALRERQQIQKDALRDQQSNEMQSIRDRHSAELESYRKMNAEKIKIAQAPSNTGQYDSIVSQLEAWGTAIAKGGEEGSKAFEDMTAWLNEIDNETLKNLIGIEIFGTKFEDQGQTIINTLLGTRDAMEQLDDATIKTTDDLKKGLSDGNATVTLADAMGKLVDALRPALDLLAMFISFVAEIMMISPGLTAIFVTIASVIGIVAGAFAGLAPILYTISSLFGGGSGSGGGGRGGGRGGGLFNIIGKIIPLISKFGKLLPWIARGFIGLSGPIGWVMLAVELLIKLVPKLIKNWSKISGFFSTLWKGIKATFKGGFKVIETLGKGLVNIIKTPTNAMIKLLNTFLKSVNKIKMPDYVPVIGGKGFNIPEIPMLAKGTNYFRGGSAIVGELGPEIVNLPVGSKVKTAKETANLLGGGGELTINVPLSIDGRAFAHAVAKYTNRELYAMRERDKRGR